MSLARYESASYNVFLSEAASPNESQLLGAKLRISVNQIEGNLEQVSV